MSEMESGQLPNFSRDPISGEEAEHPFLPKEHPTLEKAEQVSHAGAPEKVGEEKPAKRKRSPKKAAGKAARFLGWMASVVLLLTLLFASFLMVAPRFGLQVFTVLSGSMEPALRAGGMIICDSAPVEEIKVGDIIAFNSRESATISAEDATSSTDSVIVTHRVIDIKEEEGKLLFQTKGDANEDPDTDLVSIKGDTVDRVVYHLPYLGFFSSFMHTRLAFLVLILGPALILITLFGKEMWVAISEFRESRKIKAAGSDEHVQGGSGENQST